LALQLRIFEGKKWWNWSFRIARPEKLRHPPAAPTPTAYSEADATRIRHDHRRDPNGAPATPDAPLLERVGPEKDKDGNIIGAIGVSGDPVENGQIVATAGAAVLAWPSDKLISKSLQNLYEVNAILISILISLSRNGLFFAIIS
jgi:hypothetical protein